MPPSPVLLALMISVTYLSETTITKDQRIREMMPKMLPLFSGKPLLALKTVLSVYKGLVPMSPNTMPIAVSARDGIARPRFFEVAGCGLAAAIDGIFKRGLSKASVGWANSRPLLVAARRVAFAKMSMVVLSPFRARRRR